MNQDKAIERIYEFIRRIDSKELVYVPTKCNIQLRPNTKTGKWIKRYEYAGTVGEALSKHLANFQQINDSDDAELKMILIDNALYWVNEAYVLEAVKTGDGIYQKYEDCLEKIEKLNREKNELEQEIQEVSTELIEKEGECKTLKLQLDEERGKHGKHN